MKQYFYLFLALLFAVEASAQLKVANIPTGAAVVVTQPSAVFVTWTVEATSADPITVVSEEGLFVLGDQTLGRVATSLSATVPPGGIGTVTETLLIPPDVSNRAFKSNAPTFFYQRTFRSNVDGSSGQSALTCRLSTSAYGNFSIAAVTLFFENERGETTFNQNDRSGRAFAEVRYNGTGLLKALWEVQEPNSQQFRVLQQVNSHITFGDRMVFETPALPPLPTVVTGRHILRFRIQEPISGFEIPPVTYFVKATDPSETKQEELVSTFPAANAAISSDTVFQWSGGVKGSILKFTVFEKGSLQKILGASTENGLAEKTLETSDLDYVKGVSIFSVSLPGSARSYKLKGEQFHRLRAGVWYLWEVEAIDSSGKAIARSKPKAFQVKAD